MTRPLSASKFLITVAAVTLVLMTVELTINYLVDPLYFFKGDKIHHRSHPFDDRIAPIARYRNTASQYNCLVLGSSRGTFLDTNSIKQYRCANFSVVAAGADTILSYAEYVKNVMGMNPEIVIVDVDGFRHDATQQTITPDFVKSSKALLSPLYYYSSLDVLLFSVERTLFPNKYPIYADQHFRKHQSTALIATSEAIKAHHATFIKGGNDPMGIEFLGDYQKLRSIFPHAKLIGFIPPIAPDPIYHAYRTAGLRGFFDAAYAFSRVFDNFYDFSVPSPVSSDLSQTYDGSHYTARTYDKIINALFNETPDFGIHVTGLSRSQYENKYIEKMKRIFSVNKSSTAQKPPLGLPPRPQIQHSHEKMS